MSISAEKHPRPVLPSAIWCLALALLLSWSGHSLSCSGEYTVPSLLVVPDIPDPNDPDGVVGNNLTILGDCIELTAEGLPLLMVENGEYGKPGAEYSNIKIDAREVVIRDTFLLGRANLSVIAHETKFSGGGQIISEATLPYESCAEFPSSAEKSSISIYAKNISISEHHSKTYPAILSMNSRTSSVDVMCAECEGLLEYNYKSVTNAQCVRHITGDDALSIYSGEIQQAQWPYFSTLKIIEQFTLYPYDAVMMVSVKDYIDEFAPYFSKAGLFYLSERLSQTNKKLENDLDTFGLPQNYVPRITFDELIKNQLYIDNINRNIDSIASINSTIETYLDKSQRKRSLVSRKKLLIKQLSTLDGKRNSLQREVVLAATEIRKMAELIVLSQSELENIIERERQDYDAKKIATEDSLSFLNSLKFIGYAMNTVYPGAGIVFNIPLAVAESQITGGELDVDMIRKLIESEKHAMRNVSKSLDELQKTWTKESNNIEDQLAKLPTKIDETKLAVKSCEQELRKLDIQNPAVIVCKQPDLSGFREAEVSYNKILEGFQNISDVTKEKSVVLPEFFEYLANGPNGSEYMTLSQRLTDANVGLEKSKAGMTKVSKKLNEAFDETKQKVTEISSLKQSINSEVHSFNPRTLTELFSQRQQKVDTVLFYISMISRAYAYQTGRIPNVISINSPIFSSHVLAQAYRPVSTEKSVSKDKIDKSVTIPVSVIQSGEVATEEILRENLKNDLEGLRHYVDRVQSLLKNEMMKHLLLTRKSPKKTLPHPIEITDANFIEQVNHGLLSLSNGSIKKFKIPFPELLAHKDANRWANHRFVMLETVKFFDTENREEDTPLASAKDRQSIVDNVYVSVTHPYGGSVLTRDRDARVQKVLMRSESVSFGDSRYVIPENDNELIFTVLMYDSKVDNDSDKESILCRNTQNGPCTVMPPLLSDYYLSVHPVPDGFPPIVRKEVRRVQVTFTVIEAE